MKRGRELGETNLIDELKQGREMATQLKSQLHPASGSPESCDDLLEKLLSCYDRALSMLKFDLSVASEQPLPAAGILESPISVGGGSPTSEGSDPRHQIHQDVFKKRKTLPRWSEQVRICSETGLEGPLDDGYNWRKYGQKNILEAKFPRAYYRCTHRKDRGCLATKQVQRSDDDPSLVEVTYRGRHTCVQSSHSSAAMAATLEKESPKQSRVQFLEYQEQGGGGGGGGGENRNRVSGFLGNEIFPSFSLSCEEGAAETHIFLENSPSPPAFMSPATSESNYCFFTPDSPCQATTSFGFEEDRKFQSSESDFTEIISYPTTSLTNSPVWDLDFSIDPVDFTSSFPFDNPEFFH